MKYCNKTRIMEIVVKEFIMENKMTRDNKNNV